MAHIILIAHNLRSCHNVGSLLRTAEGLGIDMVILSGYTPYPLRDHDTRLPHIANKLDKQINETALGAEKTQKWRHYDDIADTLRYVRDNSYQLAAVEQATAAIPLPEFTPPERLALLMGREVEGVEPEILADCDMILEIPMFGSKESFNVVQAAAMTLYHCRFTPFKA
jgi:23S rRNA (guanosine2251-2'-O)-methyltransferase